MTSCHHIYRNFTVESQETSLWSIQENFVYYSALMQRRGSGAQTGEFIVTPAGDSPRIAGIPETRVSLMGLFPICGGCAENPLQLNLVPPDRQAAMRRRKDSRTLELSKQGTSFEERNFR